MCGSEQNNIRRFIRVVVQSAFRRVPWWLALKTMPCSSLELPFLDDFPHEPRRTRHLWHLQSKPER
jgi:hypothetical protein